MVDSIPERARVVEFVFVANCSDEMSLPFRSTPL